MGVPIRIKVKLMAAPRMKAVIWFRVMEDAHSPMAII